MIFVQPTPSRELDEFNLAIARHELEHLRRPAFQWMETGFVPIPFDARRAADVQREIAALEARLGIAPARKRPSLAARWRKRIADVIEAQRARNAFADFGITAEAMA